jgi:glycine dehydrogenase subunit 2
MYFPLVVHGAFLIEPTETESKQTLDGFIAALRDLAQKAKNGEVEFFKQSPRYTPRRRLDETQAARQPVLKWTPPDDGENGKNGEPPPAKVKAVA